LGGEVWNHRTCGSTVAHLSREREVWSHRTHGSTGAHLIRELRFGAIGHVATPESTATESQGPDPEDTWHYQSPPQPGGEVRSHKTRGSAGAHLNWEARFGAVGHMAAPEPTSAGRGGPVP
jgi:hypothetical protein